MAEKTLHKSEKVEGTRILCNGDFGTLKYFGPVPPSTGLWYGVEWDAEGRGKHSGGHKGVQYFTCQQPGNGSFVRAEKLDFGVDVVEALLSKFSDLRSKDKFSQFDCVYHVSKDESGASEEKLKRLERISLRGTNVSRGPERPLGWFAPNIVELDLSNTLLSDWQEVVNIAKDLCHLRELDVSGLRLKPVSFDMERNKLHSLPLKTLVLNYMKLNWQHVFALVSTFCGLEQLHASFNDVKSLKLEDVSPLETLCKIHLDGNNISDWDDVFLLQALPCLEVLVLSKNPLGDVTFPGESTEVLDLFSKLKSLGLVENMISSWSSVDQLNRLQALEVLALKCCPLVSSVSPFDARQELIARIARCNSLNGSAVTIKERKAAERAYLKKYAHEWLASGGKADNSYSKVGSNFMKKQPRYLSLLEVHGVPDNLAASSSKDDTLKSSLIIVSIRCANDADKQSIVKKLPASMTISKLKGLLQRIFKVSPSKQVLSYVDENDHEINLEDDLRPLSFYSVSSGGIINLKW